MYKVTVIGGGTGSFTILNGLKNFPDLDLAAIITMFDDGGSSGTLRDELGALPPGDIRQCLVALSESDEIWRQVFNFRFNEGIFAGQNFGNLLITAFQQITGSFEMALNFAGEILKTKGKVIPVTLDDVHLIARTPDGEVIVGEHKIDLKEKPIESLRFKPEPGYNPKAIERLLNSDMIVICPGDVYTSILPNLMVRSMAKTIRASKALKVYICNIMTQKMHTANFRVIDFIKLIESYLGQKDIFDFVLYNSRKPDEEFLAAYSQEGEFLVEFQEEDFVGRKTVFLGKDFLSQKIPMQVKGDNLRRALIRHDSIEVALTLYELLKKESEITWIKWTNESCCT
ncbi:putative gluconeogenesis factor [Gammaproteobacteria bacterium]